MRGITKMTLANRSREGGMRNEQGGNGGMRNAYNAYNGMENRMEGAQGNYGPESRRDSRGRYAPRNEGMNNAYGEYNEGGSMRMGSDKGWIVKPMDRMEDGSSTPESWMPPYWESRFRDRRGREHYNNGRYAPARSRYGGDEVEDRYDGGSENRMPPVYDNDMEYRYDRTGYRQDETGNRMIGFAGAEMGSNYRADATHKHKDELSHYRSQKQSGHASSMEAPLDRKTAQEWVQKMKNADGSTGEHWTFEQTSQVMKQRGVDCDPVEFYAAMNMLWSDYGSVAKKYGTDNVEYWAEMAKSFLLDKDAEGNKLALYYENIAKK